MKMEPVISEIMSIHARSGRGPRPYGCGKARAVGPRIGEMIGTIFGVILLASCSEPVDVHTRDMDRTYLIVEGLLTDKEGMDQYVKLSESLPYFSQDPIPTVSGAEVVVNDGENDIPFTEQLIENEDGTKSGSGEYRAPEGFRAHLGRTYKLRINAMVAGEPHSYEAESEMPEIGFTIDKIDYTYNGKTQVKLDSLWTVLMWGADDRNIDNRFLAYISVNGKRIPLSQCLMIEDKYFNGKKIEAFPCGLLYQTAENRKQYGECYKFLEEGDVIGVEGYVLSPEYFRFMVNIQGDGGGTSNMPFFSSQPANPVTNIHGDGDVLGYFAVCSTAQGYCTVTDPFQTINYKLQ